MVNKIEHYQLQAYVDGELSTEERLQIETVMESDAQINQEVIQLQELKSRVKQAYLDIPVPEHKEKTDSVAKRVWSVPKTAAASLLLGVVLGISSVQLGGFGESHIGQLAANQAVESNKYIIHIDSGDLDKQILALQKIESLYAQKGPSLKVDVISNSQGVKLFDVKSPNSQRLESLLDQYSGLTLYACSRAIERAMKKGETIQVLKRVKHDKPAVDAMAERMNAGWNYIKI
ncbi:hypothetical protein QCB44_08730 [Thiomicrorhabdus sp. zzn3]|uniref:hypothetical protein n=1 Tax=Thiomicrorhabdus sp. zzn3 TaxID=3039775 RepID=UPI002436BEFE|nr:hypothetical protein [Thiomicrorhabdus sp. zzn3]MDG6778788.1 hypothetical protein [Thiomicrorhabdus sp. zzn3]